MKKSVLPFYKMISSTLKFQPVIKSLILLTLLLSIFSVSAQSEYIIKNGRKITSVDVFLDYGHNEYIRCEINTTEGSEVFTAEQLDGYQVKDRKPFVSKVLNGKRRFLQAMYEGEMTLYKYVNADEKTVFYLENLDSLSALKPKSYKEVLKRYWPSCIPESIIENIQFEVGSITDAIKMINTCKVIYVPKSRSFIYVTFGQEKGVGRSNANVESLFPRSLYQSDDWEFPHYTYGVGYFKKKPIVSNSVGINFGLELSFRKYSERDNFVRQDGSTNRYFFSSSTVNLGVPLMVEMSNKIGNVISFLELGLKPSYNIINMGKETFVNSNPFTSIDKVSLQDANIEDVVNIGLIVGVGIELSIRGRLATLGVRGEVRKGITRTHLQNKNGLHTYVAYQLNKN